MIALLAVAVPSCAASAGALPSGSESSSAADTSADQSPQLNLDAQLYGADGELRDAAIGDLGNPRGALMNLLSAAGGGDYRQAVKSLQLPGDMTDAEAEDIAGKLTYVLRQRLRLEADVLPDRADGLRKEERERGRSPRESILLTEFEVGGERIPVRLVRTDTDEGPRWLFDSQTVAGTDTLYDHTGMGRVISVLPFYRIKYEMLGTDVFRLGLAVLGLAISAILAALIRRVALRMMRRLLPTDVVSDWLPFLERYLSHGFLSLLFFALLGSLSRPLILLPPRWNELYDSLVFVGVVASVTWLLINAVRMYFSTYGQRKLRRLEGKSIFSARTYHTKMTVLSRSLIGVIFFVGTVVALSTFDWFASLGLSLLASAGLISVVIGIGAQRTIANLFAGLQVALTQPMRIGDMVIFKGDWGYIENITYTYVVIRIWDLRRLTVPTTMLIDEPVYNYSHASEEGDLKVYGEVYLYLDYSVPIDRIREKLVELVKDDDNHDGEVASVLVTDCRDWNVEVRALVSATDGLAAWYLRCKVREGLIRFLQDLDGGRYLPRSRVVLERERADDSSGEPSAGDSEERPRQSQEERRGVGERPDDLLEDD
ncbi:mechanosensitive ion channel [Guyparkeria halophila]|uniref:Mechanosensitive ion channel n=1 Tax=Guyparkeria halophila TaxID=47960 RepID=A0ABZ0Z1U3_9GAMM|nr:mechanosensitive ion channel domain-containing protein [Guyparkeria halophila]WQH17392.1 mechanosensitive ion channel [Guyparkeria halophila]